MGNEFDPNTIQSDVLKDFQFETAEPDKTAVDINKDIAGIEGIPKDNQNIADAAKFRHDTGLDTYVWVNKKKHYSNMCATFVCKSFADAGVDIPYSENAGRLTDLLDKDPNFIRIDKKEDIQVGDIVALPGGGPSGLHVGIAGSNYEEPSWEYGNLLGGATVYHDRGWVSAPSETKYTKSQLANSKEFKFGYRYIGNKAIPIEEYMDK
tara:strand:- start:587 stop:1210 length:624 start_codon:yes stop_codon:yes gene_type:complete